MLWQVIYHPVLHLDIFTTVLDRTRGQKVATHMLVSGRIMTGTDKVLTLMTMEINTKVDTKMVKKMDMAYIFR